VVVICTYNTFLRDNQSEDGKYAFYIEDNNIETFLGLLEIATLDSDYCVALPRE
jgi:hypothetical protein